MAIIIPEAKPADDKYTLLTEAARCRRLARRILDKHTSDVLTRLAQEYEGQAAQADRRAAAVA